MAALSCADNARLNRPAWPHPKAVSARTRRIQRRALGSSLGGDIFPDVPITAGVAIPVLEAQEGVGRVSQAAGAAASRLAARDHLAHEVNPLAVLGRNT